MSTEEKVLKSFRVILPKSYKCGCCNWNTGTVYVLAESEDQAKQISLEKGVCLECFIDTDETTYMKPEEYDKLTQQPDNQE